MIRGSLLLFTRPSVKPTFYSPNTNVLWKKKRLQRTLTRSQSYSKHKEKCQFPLIYIWTLLIRKSQQWGALLNNPLVPMTELKDSIWDAQSIELFIESLVCFWHGFRYCSSVLDLTHVCCDLLFTLDYTA